MVLAPVLLSDGVLVIGGVTGVRIDGAHSSGIRLEEATLPNRGGVGSLIGGYTPRDLLASLGDRLGLSETPLGDLGDGPSLSSESESKYRLLGLQNN